MADPDRARVNLVLCDMELVTQSLNLVSQVLDYYKV